ncbi:phage portal protein [Methylobacterium sp. E-045]|uniref:phage portal protein n=1 Tax=Methylobacterium sp. E-045 TaxID=2836575 RepID=UPI001FBA5FAD|nr:phage portal protein [Methylobacterium sp. E-045]MCJ2132460.1 phage portal protein [Methylobacterium sp. E-045]
MQVVPRIPLGGVPAAGPAQAEQAPRIFADASAWLSLDDPRLVDFLRTGTETATGISVDVDKAMRNTAMFRAVSLISYAIGMLPLQVFDEGTKEKADDHPLYQVLHREPNGWQTAFDFRVLMQMRALVKGNAYALIVRSKDLRSGLDKIVHLHPLDPDKVTPKLSADWTLTYTYNAPSGGQRVFEAKDIFHLRGITLDGLNGMSLVRQAAEAIALSLSAERAAARLFKNGTLVGGTLSHKGKLSDPAFERLKESLAEKEGADNAGKNLILEEGMTYAQLASSARDAQMTELRKHQVEEIARVTGVPRPLLMVDETSWGSGVESLGRFFVQYGLGPWFEAWQQGAERSLLVGPEKKRFTVKFNPGALLRGSTTEQADFFAKALGSGGSQGWMTQNEVRALSDMPRVEGGDTLNPGTSMVGHNGGPPLNDN